MNANELETLKPGPGLALAEIPETVEAVSGIQAAHADLMKSYDEVIRQNENRRMRQELGVSIPNCELNDWRAFQAGPLRTFYSIRGETAGRLLLLCDERLATEAAEVRKREDKIAKGFGEIMNDAQAGKDLALLLLRITGGLPVSGQLRDTRNFWHNLCRQSARALLELPRLPEPKPTASDYANELKQLLTEKDGAK